jgi:hypothetical protein
MMVVMRSVLFMFNSYNSGAATTIVGGAVGGGGMLGHTEYPITNGEWTLNGGTDTLMSYMALRLNIRNDFIRFGGIRNYYVRNEYGLDYVSCRHGVGVVQGRHILDPWNRRFVVFPYDWGSVVGLHSYEVYYSTIIDRVGSGKHNAMLMTTTVNGCRVYCLDILEGVYAN